MKGLKLMIINVFVI
jgi:hypothetical protein